MSLRHSLLLLIQSFWWGAAYVFIALALEAFAPTQVVALRTGLAAAVLMAIVLLTGGGSRVVHEIRHRPARVAAFAVVGSAAPFLLIAFGQRHVPAGLTGVLIASVPLWTALLALRLDRTQAIDRRQGAGLLLGLAGVALVAGVSGVDGAAQAVGVAAILLAAGAYALTNFLATSWYADVPAETRGVFALAGAALITLPPAVGTPGAGPASVEALAAVVLLGVGSTALGITIGFKLVDEIGPRRAALTTYLGPGFSLGLAALVLGEAVTVSAVAGLGLIVLGVITASGDRRPTVAEAVAAPRRSRPALAASSPRG